MCDDDKKNRKDVSSRSNWKGAFSFGLPLILSIIVLLITYNDWLQKNRPYLFIEFSPPSTYQYDAKGNRRVTTNIQIFNTGDIPASKIRYDWFVKTDTDNEIQNPNKFYLDRNGFIPFPNTISKGRQPPFVSIYNPDIGSKAMKIYFNVVATYEGTAKRFGLWGGYKKYWFEARAIYEFVDKGEMFPDGRKFTKESYIILDYSKWDRNSSEELPKAKMSIDELKIYIDKKTKA